MATHVNDAPEAIQENWRRFERASLWSRKTIATCQQVHGSDIVEVRKGGHHYVDADALISRTAGVAVGVFTADCVPVLVVDPLRRSVAAIHCGWKGVASNLVSKTIDQLINRDSFGYNRLLVWIGAAIQGDSYEVGQEVAIKFDKSVLSTGKSGKFQLDLPQAIHQQLIDRNVPELNIENCQTDTYTCNNHLFSYRADGRITGRMMTFVGFSK